MRTEKYLFHVRGIAHRSRGIREGLHAMGKSLSFRLLASAPSKAVTLG